MVELNGDTLCRIKDLLDQGDLSIKGEPNSSVFLLGYTGHGKTTLLNYLGQENLICSLSQSEKLCYQVINSNNNFLISDGFSSCTKIPNKLLINGSTYWDCPGFDDTSVEQDIANAYYIHKILSISTEVKIVIVVKNNLKSDRGNSFARTLNLLSQIVQDQKILFQCLTIVVTFCTPEFTNAKFSEQLLQLGKVNERCADVKELIDLICFDINRITILKKPVKVGPVDYSNRENILQAINRAQFVKFSPKLLISGLGEKYLNQLMKISENDLIVTLKILVKKIFTKCNHIRSIVKIEKILKILEKILMPAEKEINCFQRELESLCSESELENSAQNIKNLLYRIEFFQIFQLILPNSCLASTFSKTYLKLSDLLEMLIEKSKRIQLEYELDKIQEKMKRLEEAKVKCEKEKAYYTKKAENAEMERNQYKVKAENIEKQLKKIFSPEEGAFYKIINRQGKTVLSCIENNLDRGSLTIENDDRPTDTKSQWYFIKTETIGYYRIKNVSNGYVVNAWAHDTGNKSTCMRIDTDQCYTHRLWCMINTEIEGYYRIKNLFSNNVLTGRDYRGRDSVSMEYDDNPVHPSRLWKFIRISYQ